VGSDPGLAKAARSAAAVTQLAVATVAGGLIGQWGDTRFDTAPALLVTGFLLGFAGGLVALFRILLTLDRDDDPES